MTVGKQIKGMFGVILGASLGGAAIQAVGNIGTGMSAGMQSATQSMVGVGVLSTAVKTIPHKWRK